VGPGTSLDAASRRFLHRNSTYIFASDVASDGPKNPSNFEALGWMIGGSSPGRGWEFFSSLPRPDRLCGPLVFLSNGY
jgi:hypothetical protein